MNVSHCQETVVVVAVLPLVHLVLVMNGGEADGGEAAITMHVPTTCSHTVQASIEKKCPSWTISMQIRFEASQLRFEKRNALYIGQHIREREPFRTIVRSFRRTDHAWAPS